MSRYFKKIITFHILFIFIVSILVTAGAFSEIRENKSIAKNTDDVMTYKGFLRIYIVEPTSRYDMYDNRSYHYGFIDFAQEEQLSINYNENYENTVVWNGDVTEDNVFVIAAIFNPNANIGYAHPPSSKPFDAYYVDAVAAAHPNQNGSNIRDETFSHTVFIEEGTATWCKNCPSMADALFNVSKNSETPFYYAAMIEDKNDDAADRVRDELGIYGFPTVYFDGGKKTLLGGNHGESVVESYIDECSKSDVHDLDLDLYVDWLGNGQLKIKYNITNLEESTNQMLEIKKVRGGIKKVKVFVKNTGETKIKNVNWEITLSGGMFDRVDTEMNGKIRNFRSGALKRIVGRAGIFRLYGFGRIDIVIQIGTTIKTMNGLLIGRVIIILR